MITSQPMSSSLVLQNNPSKPNIPNSPFSARSHRVNIKWPVITMYCASRLRSMQMVVVRADKVPTMAIPQDNEQSVNPDDKRINSKESNSGGGPKLSNTGGQPNILIQTILSWAKWFVWSFVAFFPFYKNIAAFEDRFVNTTTTALHVVESVAQVIDKGAKDFERSLPENLKLKKVVQKLEKFSEEVYKDAEVTESVVVKGDDIFDKLGEKVESVFKDKIAHDGRKKYRRN
ncbi:uncharacterized protein LOC144546468 isoform X2 [Carex rostrata]